jgi:hypothetical protein
VSLITDTDTGKFGKAGAIFDQTRTYRYRLWRTWDPDLPRMMFCMLNPSTADAFVLDPTVRRCVGFAQREGCGTLEVVNVFALRSTDPKALKSSNDPVGPENDAQILGSARDCDLHIAAWGAHAAYLGRGEVVKALLFDYGINLAYLRLTKEGHPGHPLYIAADQPLEPWY